MLNWDLYTHSESKEFSLSTSVDEKYALSLEWKKYMEETNSWISFYIWKKLKEQPKLHMAYAKTSSA